MKINTFIAHLSTRWQRCFRKNDQFLKENAGWLDLNFELPNKSGRNPSEKVNLQAPIPSVSVWSL